MPLNLSGLGITNQTSETKLNLSGLEIKEESQKESWISALVALPGTLARAGQARAESIKVAKLLEEKQRAKPIFETAIPSPAKVFAFVEAKVPKIIPETFIEKGRVIQREIKEKITEPIIKHLPFGIGARLLVTSEQEAMIREKYKDYTFEDVAKDVANLGLEFTVNPLARLGLTGQELITGEKVGFGAGIGFQDAKTFTPSVIGSLPSIYKYHIESGDSPEVAGLRTGITFGFDALIGFGIALKSLPSVRSAARQLPESLLFRFKTENMPVDEVIGSLTGSNPTSRGNAFISSLSNEERKSLFGLARAYEQAGGQPIEILEKTPTKLGGFARVEPTKVPTEIRPELQLPGFRRAVGEPRFAPGLRIEKVEPVGFAKNEYVKITNKKTGESIETKVISIRPEGIVAKEPKSGILIFYKDDKFDFFKEIKEIEFFEVSITPNEMVAESRPKFSRMGFTEEIKVNPNELSRIQKLSLIGLANSPEGMAKKMGILSSSLTPQEREIMGSAMRWDYQTFIKNMRGMLTKRIKPEIKPEDVLEIPTVVPQKAVGFREPFEGISKDLRAKADTRSPATLNEAKAIAKELDELGFSPSKNQRLFEDELGPGVVLGEDLRDPNLGTPDRIIFRLSKEDPEMGKIWHILKPISEEQFIKGPEVKEFAPVGIVSSKELQALAEEARRYKSAEEFVNSQIGEMSITGPRAQREWVDKKIELTDFYNQATKGIEPPRQPPKPPKPTEAIPEPEPIRPKKEFIAEMFKTKQPAYKKILRDGYITAKNSWGNNYFQIKGDVPSIVKEKGITERQKVEADIDKLAEGVNKPVIPVEIGKVSDSIDGIKLETEDGKSLIVDRDYFNIVVRHISSEAKFYALDETKPIIAKKGDEVLAAIMPMKDVVFQEGTTLPIEFLSREKALRPIKTDKDIARLIAQVEKEQKKLLTQAQKNAIQKLHDIAKPSDITKFYAKVENQSWIKMIKQLQSEKELSNMTISRIKKALQIENLKQTAQPKLQELYDFLSKLEKGDAFLSKKQMTGLRDILKDIDRIDLVPKRVVIDMFGEKDEVLPGGLIGKVMNELVPSVDIKEGHPLVERVVNKSDELLTRAEKEVQRRDNQVNEMLERAEKSRGRSLKEKLTSQNREIFEAMSGKKIELIKEEVALVAYLKNFFKKVREDLKLEKYRQNYITHLERPLMEKIVNDGLIKSVVEMFKLKEKEGIPLNLMLELDNIIGSEKFFRFALERKGGLTPTTNIRKIVHAYSRLYETKKALDQVLPEGQAVVQLLLQPETAVWTKKFLQNLKGRGLDYNFRRGKMAWLARLADQVIDIGYVKLLGLNWVSALKNLGAGEANSFIYQDFWKYLRGKNRFVKNPIKSVRLAQEYGVLEGTFADYAARGIGRLKKLEDLFLIGQRGGEYEIRSSLFVSELTKEEWTSGKVTPERMREIKDIIAITQGIFSKTDSPLWLQTWYGRLFMQMNRWRVTNVLLLRRLAKDRNYKGLSKAFILYGIGMYLAYEFGKAGYKKLSQIAQAMAEEINSVIQLVTLKPITDALTSNPTLSVLKELTFSIQELADYIGVPGVREPQKVQFQRGIEETFIAPFERPKELLGIGEEPMKARDILKKYGIGATENIGASRILQKYGIK